MPDCRHPVGQLIQCEAFPEKRAECGLCGKTFLLHEIVAFGREGAATRLIELSMAQAGKRKEDARPLEHFLAKGVSLEQAAG